MAGGRQVAGTVRARLIETAKSIPEPDRRDLRRFGLIMGGAVAVLFGLLVPWLAEGVAPLWPWVGAAVLIAWSLIAPATLRPVYFVWMGFGLVMNRVMTPLVLSLVFFLVVTPMGTVRRALGRGIPKHFDPDARTYRVPREPGEVEHLERPF
jgi:hypothetical protein